MWSEKSHVGLDFLTQLCAEKDPFLNVILPQASTSKVQAAKSFTMSTYKWCDQRNLMWVWISSDSFALKRIRFWMSSFHKQSTSSKVLYKVNLQAMWSEKSHVGLDFLTQLCAEKDPFLNVILPQAKYKQQSPLQCQLTSDVIREISCGFGFPHTALRWKGSVFECHPSTSKVQVAKSFTMSTYKRCDQRNLMWVWISSHSFALKRIRFWMSSFHKKSTSRSEKSPFNVNLQAMWSEKSHVGLDFLTQLCAEKDPFLNVILPQAKYKQQSPLQCQLTSDVIREISCGFGFPHTALRWKGSVFECHPSTSKVQAAKSFTMSTYKRCDQRNLMWVWISSHSFALKRIRFWMSSFHKQSTRSKVLHNVNLQAMWKERSHVGLDFLTRLCAEKDPFLHVCLPFWNNGDSFAQLDMATSNGNVCV